MIASLQLISIVSAFHWKLLETSYICHLVAVVNMFLALCKKIVQNSASSMPSCDQQLFRQILVSINNEKQLLNTFGDFYLVTLVISYDDYCIQNSINLKLQYFESKISTLSSNSFLVFIRPFLAPFSLFLSIQYSWQ